MSAQLFASVLEWTCNAVLMLTLQLYQPYTLHYMPIRRIGVMTYNADLALQDKQSRYTVGENNYLIPF